MPSPVHFTNFRGTSRLSLSPAIVTIEQFVPALVSGFNRHTRRVDDVGEENGRQDPIRFGNSAIAMSGDEFLDVADQPLARS